MGKSSYMHTYTYLNTLVESFISGFFGSSSMKFLFDFLLVLEEGGFGFFSTGYSDLKIY